MLRIVTFFAFCKRNIAICRYNWPTIIWPKEEFWSTTSKLIFKSWSNLWKGREQGITINSNMKKKGKYWSVATLFIYLNKNQVLSVWYL